MYAAIAEIIIENEKNDYRFENFTREICEKHEGITFVPTSQSWDRGRDARATPQEAARIEISSVPLSTET